MKKIIIFILTFIPFYGTCLPQSNEIVLRSSPSYTIQFNLIYNQAAFELSGAYNDDNQSRSVYNGESFGADKGFGFNLTSKVSLDRRRALRFTQSFSYNRMLTYTFGSKNIADNGNASFNCFVGGLGIEYCLTPTYKIKLYVGAEINASLINGEAKIWFDNVSNPPPTDTTYKILSSFRGGLALSAGGEYLISENVGINLGVKLINANIIGKQAEGTNEGKEFKLRDAANPNLKFAGNKDKDFAFYSVMAGISFYFGVKTKVYRIYRNN